MPCLKASQFTLSCILFAPQTNLLYIMTMQLLYPSRIIINLFAAFKANSLLSIYGQSIFVIKIWKQ